MEQANLVAELYRQAERLQSEAHELQSRLSNIYNAAVKLRNLAVTVADRQNNEPENQDIVEEAIA